MDGVLDPSEISGGPWTCDTYRGLSDTAFCEFEEINENCCHCGGGTKQAVSSTVAPQCEDIELYGLWSAGGWSCSLWIIIYGSEFSCDQSVLQDHCCQCGGGSSQAISTTQGIDLCEDIELDSTWSSGVAWTCAAFSGLDDDAAHCANEEIAHTCCQCQVSVVEMTVTMSSTAEGQDTICNETSLATGGGTHRSVAYSLNAAGVSTGSSSVTLSCSNRRLATNRMRSLQTDFSLVSSASFADVDDATLFSERVTGSSSDIASELEGQVAQILDVDVNVTVTDVELMVYSDGTFVSGHQRQGMSVCVYSLSLVVAGAAFFSID